LLHFDQAVQLAITQLTLGFAGKTYFIVPKQEAVTHVAFGATVKLRERCSWQTSPG
jgi:hypothetical protein